MKKIENKNIIIKGARVHNLKNIDLEIPHNKLIVITGLSGSGKSSLAFDTIYAEGQRRYVESLSSYARQFLGRMNKPEVDLIKGIPPAIAIEQKVNTRNPRSTVGTSTEIYDYLKLLFARIGQTYSPFSEKPVKKHTVTDIVDFIVSHPENTKLLILCPLNSNNEIEQTLEDLKYQGITRLEIDNHIVKLSDFFINNKTAIQKSNIVVDRIIVNNDPDSISRFSDSVNIALKLGNGVCIIKDTDLKSFVEKKFTDRFESDGITFEIPSVHMFSFNNPVGACPKCEGYGKVIGIDEDLVIPDKNLSVYQDAIVCWKGEKMQKWKQQLILHAEKFNFPVHKPFIELSGDQKNLLWAGNQFFKGLDAFFNYLESKKYKIQYRVMLSRYKGKTICPECKGTRLKKETRYIKINDKNIQDLVVMPVDKLKQFFEGIRLTDYERKIANRILTEINNRLSYLCDVGLSYLTLNRLSSSLSGGESQRINLATMLGSSLVGSIYILDEPSIGLHSKDTNRLIKVLRNLQKTGNTILVVEHDEEIMRSADDIIDVGPDAGRLGGEIVFHGSVKKLIEKNTGYTAKYLNGEEKIEIPSLRRKWNNYIEIKGACENNLKGIDVKIPLNTMTVVTGVSGSGKSSLIKNILYPALQKALVGFGEKSGQFANLIGDISQIHNIEFIDQNPIGKSSRSNPVTYLKAFDEIRKLYADQQSSLINGFKPSHFSFNIEGGRCEECQGEGVIKVEMQFMADIYLTCESCQGKRYKDDILEIRYKEKNIHDLLECTVNEAIEFFSNGKSSLEKKIIQKLTPLADVGLGYIKLGQSSSTLSGGESQRVKLASFLGTGHNSHTLFLFDEPTTGLHFHDIKKLLDAFNSLLKLGHSIVIIEHNMEIIKCADWLIDLGPEGGENGGYVVFEGVPEDLVKNEKSYTGKYLKEKLKNRNYESSCSKSSNS